MMAGLGIGGALSPPLTLWLVTRHGWPFPFFAYGAVGLAIGVLWWTFGSDAPAGPRAPKTPTPWRALARSRSVWALSLSYGVAGYTSYVFFTWFFLYLVNVRKVSLTQ